MNRAVIIGVVVLLLLAIGGGIWFGLRSESEEKVQQLITPVEVASIVPDEVLFVYPKDWGSLETNSDGELQSQSFAHRDDLTVYINRTFTQIPEYFDNTNQTFALRHRIRLGACEFISLSEQGVLGTCIQKPHVLAEMVYGYIEQTELLENAVVAFIITNDQPKRRIDFVLSRAGVSEQMLMEEMDQILNEIIFEEL